MKVSKLSLLLCLLLLLDGAGSEVYRVGDDSGWNSGTGTNYLTWSRKYNFTVADVLVFKYSKSQHNVKEVIDATFQSCDTSNGVLATYKTGNDEIGLSEARKYNFVCDIDEHCIGGMRFSILVSGDNSNNNSNIAPTSPPPAVPGSSCAFTVRGKMAHIVGMGILILLFMF